ncbi:esterase/lipase family protein [Dokdonella fugitiva]|uniref:esterase/lipase family protein n=1 Tax=Dokdonella fugitiva TaxID=328517 RepID=UPI00185E0573|nr:alpha/beta fold hydrolase [Dokdonella fugitiva]MBA8882585.1 pimeloyl-ACP methyl ester carboxylesterase [Dokdonella fugitiva]
MTRASRRPIDPRAARTPRAAVDSAPREHVILLHGIWMRGITLLPLARRLRQAGYSVETIDYASVFRGIQPAVMRLRERMQAQDAGAVHLVGHSLGSLVALEATRGVRGLPKGGIVCIGPPLRGSAVARALTAFPGGRLLLGQSAEPLLEGVDAWKGSRRVGVIAGKLPFGLGITLGPLVAPHDGTVSVEETQLPGISDHRTVDASHTGLLFSSEVADLTVMFLRAGRFAPTPR